MNEKQKCWHCHRDAEYRYKGFEDGPWFYLYFWHWGATAIARVTHPDAVFTKTCERISDTETVNVGRD